MLKFERQPVCPVCGIAPEDDARRYRVQYTGIPSEFVTCHGCGVIWQWDRLADDYVGEYYRTVYRQITAPNEAARAQTAAVGEMRAAIQAAYLSPFLTKCKSLLDFGCSGGWLLDALAPLGLELYGVESDESGLSEFARRRYKIFNTLDEAPNGLHAVTMSHVLEHFNHPGEILRQIYAKLAPGGLLFVDVPNYRACNHAMILHHPVAYDAASMARLLTGAGFEIADSRCYDWDNTPMDKYLMTIAAKPGDKKRRSK
jgi:SAM-dependent methyltransferase